MIEWQQGILSKSWFEPTIANKCQPGIMMELTSWAGRTDATAAPGKFSAFSEMDTWRASCALMDLGRWNREQISHVSQSKGYQWRGDCPRKWKYMQISEVPINLSTQMVGGEGKIVVRWVDTEPGWPHIVIKSFCFLVSNLSNGGCRAEGKMSLGC